MLESWAHGIWAPKLSKNADFSSQKLGKFWYAVKWSIFHISWKSLNFIESLESKFIEFGKIFMVEPYLEVLVDVSYQPNSIDLEVKMRLDLLMLA